MKKTIIICSVIAVILVAILAYFVFLTPVDTETNTILNTVVIEEDEIQEDLDVNEEDEEEIDLGDEIMVEISVKDFGIISLELYEDIAPITVENFVGLVKDGFYDGLTFHRIIDGFMIQGGDPLGNGTGGSENTIKGEFSSNGIENNLTHDRGVISMARSQLSDSASSQFFIMHASASYLDGQYAAFGRVTSGMEVVDSMVESAIVEDSNGTVSSENQAVIEYVKIVE